MAAKDAVPARRALAGVDVRREIPGMRLPLLSIALLLAACSARPSDLPPVEMRAYDDTIARFHQQRVTAIAGPEGWAALLGLWWLEPGPNRLGSDSTFEVVLPRAR